MNNTEQENFMKDNIDVNIQCFIENLSYRNAVREIL